MWDSPLSTASFDHSSSYQPIGQTLKCLLQYLDLLLFSWIIIVFVILLLDLRDAS